MDRMNLLICDLDGTLLGDDQALEEFANWYTNARNQFRLAYSSGRFIDSVRESIDALHLPEPDAVIGGVGTEIYDVAAGRRVSMWPPSTFGWNPHIVRAICESHRELRPQPEEFLSYYKVSFYGTDLEQSFIDHLLRQMAWIGQEANVVYSSNRDLDFVPPGVDKGAASRFLARHWQIDQQRVIVAGDSGNDAAMFHVGYRGIVVGNARSELQSLIAPHIYHASGEYAAGVLEGISYWLQIQPRIILQAID